MDALNNIVVAISGGAGRLGSAFSASVVENGGCVVIGDVIAERGQRLAYDLGKESALYFHGDLTDPDVVDRMIRECLKKFGKLDAAVHSAYPVSKQWGTPFESLQAPGLETDLFRQLGGAILFSQRLIQHFRGQGYGNLIHISSIQGVSAPKFEHYEGTAMVSPIEYSAIKAGVIAITQYLAKYCKNEGIRVNCISPGGIEDKQPQSFLDRYRSNCVSKGMLDSHDIVGTLLFLLSKQSKYITGQNIVVDDGWTL